MDEEKYIRKVQTSATVFLYCRDDYLFVKRSQNIRVDPGCLNGVGGRLEPGENYAAAAVREIREETGYEVETQDLQLAAVIKLEGGYQEDWVMCFFKAEVPDKKIPSESKDDDGELVWINKDKVLDSDYELVDDLNYCFKDIVDGKSVVFMGAKVGDDHKIYETNISKLQGFCI